MLLSCAITFSSTMALTLSIGLAQVFLDHGFRGIGIVQPVSDSGHRIQGLAIGNGFHRAAVGVTADDDIRYAKCDNRVFDGCGYTTRFRTK